MGVTPRMLRWDVNSKCNLSCSHCCVGDDLRNDKIKDLSNQEFIQSLERMRNAGVESIHFIGGEPTIRLDFLEILEKANNLGFEISFNTNGIRQDQKYIDTIFSCSKIRKVVVSLDGYDEYTNSLVRGVKKFDKTVSFIKKF